jgi:hypothetical protein
MYIPIARALSAPLDRPALLVLLPALYRLAKQEVSVNNKKKTKKRSDSGDPNVFFYEKGPSCSDEEPYAPRAGTSSVGTG